MTDYAILVSGWSGPGIEWRFSPIRGQLRDEGFQTHHFSRKGLGWDPIRATADDLRSFILDLAPEKEDRVSLVGHSMGGLVARHLSQAPGGLIDAIVTVCTPNYGVEHAEKVLFSGSCADMALNSDFLTGLNYFHGRLVPTMCVYGAKDKLVKPESAVWDGADWVLRAEGGHVTPIYDASVARHICHFLKTVRSGRVLS